MSDTAARIQIRTELDTTLFVEAGAGTGKTTALVARIIHGITQGRVRIGRVAAITFTESAAGELRDRLTVALERAAHGLDPELDDAARARAADALQDLDDAVITTIHGFAQRVCAEWAPTAGLPAGFTVRDDIAAGIAFEHAWRRFLDDWYADPDAAEHLQCAAILGCTTAHLRQIALALHQNIDRLMPEPESQPQMPTLDFAPVIDALRDAAAFGPTCTDPTDRLLAHLESLLAFADRLDAAQPDPLDALDVLLRGPNILSKNGRAPNWPDKSAVIDALATADAARTAVLAPLRGTVLRAAGARIAGFVRALADARVRAGELEFDDLLRVARNLLRDHPEVRGQVADRWQVLAIDEFQDTDPLQVEIALLLADADAELHPETRWSELSPVAGRLFLVGDPKQSIYRFRRADLALYRRVVTELPGTAVALDTNFRTVPPILDWVNTSIAALLEAGGSEQAQWRALAPRRSAAPSNAGAAVVTLGGARDDLGADALRALEADTVVRAVLRMQAEGWTVFDPEADAWRPARLADIAILVPTRAAVRSLERAFEAAGIPLRIESRTLLWDAPEVRDLLTVLHAIDDPSDELAVVGALRTPAFACTDRELLEFHRGGGTFDARRFAPPELDAHPVTEALTWIRKQHDTRWWTPTNVLVEGTVRERTFFAAALATPRERDRWRHLRFVIDQARAFAAAGGASLRTFLEWADDQAEHGAYVNDAVAPESDDDAVRLMTAHAAKGLEFPIAMLVGWNQKYTDRSDPVLWSPVQPGAFEINVGSKEQGLTTAGYDGLLQPELDAQRAERDRLLYVAATRARDHLVVSLFHKGGTACDAARLAAVLDNTGVPNVNWDETLPAPTAPAGPAPVTTAHPIPDAAWHATRADVLGRAATPAVIAATTLAHAMRTDDEPTAADPEPDGTERPWRRGRAGTAVGRAVHAVLQTVDLSAGSNLAALATAHAIAEGVPERTDEIAKLAASALGAPSVQAAAASTRHWREIPVGAPFGARILEGYIDLCYDTPAGLVIVDYKTDAVSGRSLETAVERYTPQGAAYAAVLETVLQRPVADCVFVFCRPGAAVEVHVADLPSAVASVRAELLGSSSPASTSR